MNALRELFLLDLDVVFLNHGSFGACPIPVFETYQRWQRELERQPVEFIARRRDDLLNEARAKLAAYVNCNLDELIFVHNATAGINLVARSLKLDAGDEILTTDLEYGAIDYTWNFVCGNAGATTVRQPMPLPMTTAEAFVEHFWSAVTPRTKVIAISHIASTTALIFPIEEVCRRARAAGILTVIDGAHVPGHIALDLKALGADFYTGNCHKWLCVPKGAAFLYARREHHVILDPLVISWGWTEGASFVEQNQYQGTNDFSAYLSVPAAIEFQKAHDWDTVRRECHILASEASARISEWSGLEPLSPNSPEWFRQMVTAPLPPCDIEVVKRRLYDEFRVEIPLVDVGGKPFIRASFQGYNTVDDLNKLLEALNVVVG